MRTFVFAVVYTALVLAANGAVAQDAARLEALRTGDMEKLAVAATPVAAPLTPFTAADGSEMTMAAYAGKYVLLNFWATWCAPCRVEMPQFGALQDAFGGDRFEVVTIATGRNSLPQMESFFAEIGVDTLPLHRDPQQAMARDFGVLGLPVTILIDPQGREIARLTGEAEWAGTDARALVAALIDG